METGTENFISIPLAPVLAGLPHELKSRVLQADVGEATLSVSVECVFAQISTGAVRLAFADLRQAAPELFSADDKHDHVQVALPLNEILSRINPALLVRRQDQKQIEVPQEISSPFGDRGNGLALSGPPKAPEIQPPARANTPAARKTGGPAGNSAGPTGFTQFTRKPTPAASTPTAPTPSSTPAAAPIKPHSPFKPAGFNPVPKAPTPKPPTPQQNSFKPPGVKLNVPPPTQTPQIPPAPVSSEQTPQEAAPSIPVSSALRSLGSSIGLSASSNKPTQKTPAVRPSAVSHAKPAAEQVFLTIALQPLAESWSEALRQEIVQLNLQDANLSIPLDTLEEAIKHGKAAFPWKTLRSWVKPTTLPTVSVHDSTVVELPLKVIAPLFIARKKDLSRPKQKVSVDENIPNLFFGFPQAETSAPAPAPAAIVPVQLHPSAPAAPKPTDTNYYVWDEASDSARVDETEVKRKPSIETNFLSRYATPNEVVARAIGIEGVVGALVALPDGLMVASKLPAELNGDTLAAFLPQIFGKVSQCTRELRMGDLNNLNFTVGNVPWKIFRVNAIFFAAFGQAGHGLPTAELAALAAQLDRKKQ